MRVSYNVSPCACHSCDLWPHDGLPSCGPASFPYTQCSASQVFNFLPSFTMVCISFAVSCLEPCPSCAGPRRRAPRTGHLEEGAGCWSKSPQEEEVCGPCVSAVGSDLLKVKFLSRVWLFATPWTVDYQAPLSMGFSGQGYWSGLPFPSPGDLPNPGIKPRSPTLQADALPSEPPGKPSGSEQTLKVSARKQGPRWPYPRGTCVVQEAWCPQLCFWKTTS